MEGFFKILYFSAFLAIGIGLLLVIDLRKKDGRFKTGYKGNPTLNKEFFGFGVKIIILGGTILYILNIFNITPEDYIAKKLQVPYEVTEIQQKDIWFYKDVNEKESLAFTANGLFTLAYVCLKKEKKDFLILKVFNNENTPEKIHLTGESLDVSLSAKYKLDNGFYLLDSNSIDFFIKNKSLQVKFFIDDMSYESTLKLNNSKLAISKTKSDCKIK